MRLNWLGIDLRLRNPPRRNQSLRITNLHPHRQSLRSLVMAITALSPLNLAMEILTRNLRNLGMGLPLPRLPPTIIRGCSRR